jgi:hypothetical protein
MDAFAMKETDAIFNILTSQELLSIIENQGELAFGGNSRQKHHHFDYGDTVNGIGFSVSFINDSTHKWLKVFYGSWDGGLAHGKGMNISVPIYIMEGSISPYTVAQSSWEDGFANGVCNTHIIYCNTEGYYGGYGDISGNQNFGLWEGAVIGELHYIAWEGLVHVKTDFMNGRPIETGNPPNMSSTSLPYYGINVETGEPTVSFVDSADYYSTTLSADQRNAKDEMFMISSLPYRLHEVEQGSLTYITSVER